MSWIAERTCLPTEDLLLRVARICDIVVLQRRNITLLAIRYFLACIYAYIIYTDALYIDSTVICECPVCYLLPTACISIGQ